MDKNATHRFINLALCGAITLTVGCAADASTDEPIADEFIEDRGTPEEDAELELQAQSQELSAAGVVTAVCGVENSVRGLPDTQVTEFELGQTDGALQSGDKVSLFDTYNRSYVRYGKRSLGINLTWSSSEPPGSIELHKAGGGVINYGDKVAIRVNGGGFLKYGKRTIGIMLNWVSSNTTNVPYEWEVHGGAVGTPVPKNKPVRLFNTQANDNLAYCRRPTGINLAWAKDCASVPGMGRLRTNYCP